MIVDYMKLRALLYALLVCGNVLAQTPLPIPDTLAGPNFVLTMHTDSVQFFPAGPKSPTYAFNQYSYLGPTLIFQQGQQVNMFVVNQINDTTSVHWHGIHVPAMADGGPHTPILPGDTWNPQFTILDHGATYWYHPHTHMKTALQAIRGAAGFIIVRDPVEAALTLPRTYGVDDFPIVVQSQQYDSLNRALPLGMQDSTLLVNGARANYGYSVYANMPAQVVRMRLLNGSGERSFLFGFNGNFPLRVIASDGGLLDAPVLTTRVRLSPGERAEILVDLSGMSGQSLTLMCYGSEIPVGTQGGPTMPMPFGPPMDSPLNGVDYNVLTIHVTPPLPGGVTTIPAHLTTNTPWSQASVVKTRTVRFTADSAMVMDGPFYFNDNSFDMMRVDDTIILNSVEKWKLVNETMVAHPFHIHDVQFYITDVSGNPPDPEQSGRKDVVLIPPGDSVEFITKFEDFADSTTPYMYHCHILMHEDAGMMGQFIVVPPATGLPDNADATNAYAYPNPSTDGRFSIKLHSVKALEANITVRSAMGQIIESSVRQILNGFISMDLQHLPGGIYFVQVDVEQSRSTFKIILY